MGDYLLIKHGTIHNAVTEEPFAADILAVDGKIKKIAPALEVAQESGAKVIDAAGLDIYPGFVDAHCHLGLDGYAVGFAGQDFNELGDPVTPQLSAADAINPQDETFAIAREGGVTCVSTGPGSSNVIGGTFCVIKTFGRRVDDMLVKEKSAMKIAFGENPKNCYKDKGIYSRMSIAAKLRETLNQAILYGLQLEAAGCPDGGLPMLMGLGGRPGGGTPALRGIGSHPGGPSDFGRLGSCPSGSPDFGELGGHPGGPSALKGFPASAGQNPADADRDPADAKGSTVDYLKFPAYNAKLEALLPVIRGEIPLKAHAHRADDIYTAIRIAKEFHLDLRLDHVTDGELIADDLAKEGFPVAVGPSFGHATKYELKNKSFSTPGILAAAGCSVSIITDSPVIEERYLPLCAGRAIHDGMKPFDALKAVTINAARHIGAEDRVGSIEEGKDADFVLVRGNPFAVDAHILYTIIDGGIVYRGR